MKRLYPKTKFSDEASLTMQFGHIISECIEALMSNDLERRDEELADLEHSIQTWWDIRAKQGLDVDALRNRVIEKNKNRGYYVGQLKSKILLKNKEDK